MACLPRRRLLKGILGNAFYLLEHAARASNRTVCKHAASRTRARLDWLERAKRTEFRFGFLWRSNASGNELGRRHDGSGRVGAHRDRPANKWHISRERIAPGSPRDHPTSLIEIAPQTVDRPDRTPGAKHLLRGKQVLL